MKKTVCFLLLGALLLTLCACTPGQGTPSDGAENDAKERELNNLFKGKTTEEYVMSSFTEETKGMLSVTEAFDDSGFNGVVVQGEDFASATVNTEVKTEEGLDGGAFLYAVGDVTDGDFDREFSVTYKVNVPATRRYVFKATVSTYDSTVTTDFKVVINGEEQASDDTLVETGEYTTTSYGRNVKLYPMTFEAVTLQAGENEIKFVLRGSDIETQMKQKYFFYLDKFEILPLDEMTVEGQISYADGTTGDLAEQKKAAAEYYVFTNGDKMALRLTMTAWSPASAGKFTVKVADYYGNDVFAEEVDIGFGAYAYELFAVQHPTGYFNLCVYNSKEEQVYCHSYVVMNDSKYRVMLEESPFAVDNAAADTGSGEVSYRYACVAKLAGVTWVRERARWSYIERDEGEYSTWSTDILREVKKAGIKQVTLLNGLPRWFEENEAYFITQQLSYYKMLKQTAADLKDVIDAWEVLNEQDWYQFEFQSPDLYSSFMKIGALAVADSGSNALTMIGALCQPSEDTNHLPVYVANGLLDFTAAFNYHNHIDSYTHSTVTDFSDGAVADEYGAYGNTISVPTWVTEAGIKLYYAGSDMTLTQEGMQARYLVNSTVQSLASGTDKHFWFIYRSGDPEGEGTYTSFRPDDTPRPAVVAEAVLTEMLGEGIYLGQMSNMPENAEGHVFNNGTDDVAVLWSAKEQEFTLFTDKNVLAVDLMGNKTVLPVNADGTVTLTLTKEPVYLIFDGKAPTGIYEATTNTPAQTAVAKTDFTVGQHVVMTQLWPTPMDYARSRGQAVYETTETEITLQVLNLNDVTVKGTVTVDIPDGYTVTGDVWDIEVEPYAIGYLTFKVSRSADAQAAFLTFNGVFNDSESSPCASYMVPVK